MAPKTYTSNADRQRAYRERQRLQRDQDRDRAALGAVAASASPLPFGPSSEAAGLLLDVWVAHVESEDLPTSKAHREWEAQSDRLRSLAHALGLTLPTRPSKYADKWASKGHAPTVPGTHMDGHIPTL